MLLHSAFKFYVEWMAWYIVFVFRVCRVVVLESHLCQEVTRGGTLNEEGADLYILAGHEASYWICCHRPQWCCHTVRRFSVVSSRLCKVHCKQRFVWNTCTWTSNIVTGMCNTLKVGLTWNWNRPLEYYPHFWQSYITLPDIFPF